MQVCESCGREADPDTGKIKHRITEPRPDEAQLEDWIISDGDVLATDGCVVEPDGICEHGHRSWLLRLGLV